MSGTNRQKRGIASMEDAVGGALPPDSTDLYAQNTASSPSNKVDMSDVFTPDQAAKMNALENMGYSGSSDRSAMHQLPSNQRNAAVQSMTDDANNYADFMNAPEGSKDEDVSLDRWAKTKTMLDN